MVEEWFTGSEIPVPVEVTREPDIGDMVTALQDVNATLKAINTSLQDIKVVLDRIERKTVP